jgi:RNA polymerase sigma-70 factor, ECF subfamily
MPEHIAEERELQTIVCAALDALSPNHRAVLVLHYMHEYRLS